MRKEEKMHGIYELKEMLCKELEEYGAKGELTAGSLEIVDKLAHAIKNLDKIIEASEEEGGYSERGGSYRGGSYARPGQGGGGMGGNRGGQGRSYARQGRGRDARRDSMGRYSSERGYSREDGKEQMIMQLEDLKQDAPNQQVMERIEDLISELERG